MNRQCNGCSLCCKLVPVAGLGKPANCKCRFQRYGKNACKVYDRLWEIAPECKVWNCVWLGDSGFDGVRPDRAHYVVDIMPDLITVTMADGKRERFAALQVWVDPAFPNVHRDPHLRAYIVRRDMPAIIRYSESTGFTLLPPSWTGGDWVEKESSSGPSMLELMARGELDAGEMIIEREKRAG